MRVPIFLLLFVVCHSLIIFAQDENDYFPIIGNCIPEPTLAPDDWTYSGTILMSGYAGLHGMNAEWDTPHVLMFNTYAANGDKPVTGAAMSPDGKWYAVPFGETWVEPSFNQYTWVNSIRLYKTDGSREYQEYDLRDYDFYVYFSPAWTYLSMHWVGNQSLVAGMVHIFPFKDNKAEQIPFEINNWLQDLVSPDLSRFIYRSANVPGVYTFNDEDWELVRENRFGTVAWKSDSSGFISVLNEEIKSYSRDGNLAQNIIRFQDGSMWFGYQGRTYTQWSSDNQKFVFSWKIYPDPNRIYIVDFEAEQVIDTCLNAVNAPIWSQDGAMLAYTERSTSNQNIVVIDLESWQAYIVGKHIGTQSEMLGWREN